MGQEIQQHDLATLIQQQAMQAFMPIGFVPDETIIPATGQQLSHAEVQEVLAAMLSGVLVAGKRTREFEWKLASYLGGSFAVVTNSGASANLLALTALTSPKLGGRALKAGDEVITVALSSPTMVNPIVQNGFVPVFVDVEIPSYTVDVKLIEAAITDKTGAIIFPHTLGNCFNLLEVRRIADKYKLWLIEDCGEALGSSYQGRKVGSLGDLATFDFLFRASYQHGGWWGSLH